MLEKWLIAVDLDGTLFQANHQISARTLQTMHKVVEQGHRFVIVTGRSFHSSAPRLLCVPKGTRLLCSNGAYEYDRENQRILSVAGLPASTSITIRQKILELLPAASFGWESTTGLTYEQKFIDEAGGAHTLEQGGAHQPIGQSDLIKLFLRTPEHQGRELANLLQYSFANEFEVSSSGVPFVEITATGVNKGVALAKIALELECNSECTVAFGDNFNDVSMLQWAGESVAMDNASVELKAIANSHALSNTVDGVAQYLESKFLAN